MVSVASSAIREVDYDPASATLFLRFADGDWYGYLNVPEAEHRALLTAPSIGRFFAQLIRDRYPCHRLMPG